MKICDLVSLPCSLPKASTSGRVRKMSLPIWYRAPSSIFRRERRGAPYEEGARACYLSRVSPGMGACASTANGGALRSSFDVGVGVDSPANESSHD